MRSKGVVIKLQKLADADFVTCRCLMVIQVIDFFLIHYNRSELLRFKLFDRNRSKKERFSKIDLIYIFNNLARS